MQNQEILKIIENLKGRRNYEEKKALKLGFNSSIRKGKRYQLFDMLSMRGP